MKISGNMSTDKKDPLDDLIVDKVEFNVNQILAEILKCKVEITKEGKINLIDETLKYPDWKKIIVAMLSRKVIHLKGLVPDYKESAMPRDIEKEALVSNEAIGKRIARELKGIMDKNEGGYYIPDYRLSKCKVLLENKKNNQ